MRTNVRRVLTRSSALLVATSMAGTACQLWQTPVSNATTYAKDTRSIADCGAAPSPWTDDGAPATAPSPVKQKIGPSSFTVVGATVYSFEAQKAVQAFDLDGHLLRNIPVKAAGRDLVVSPDGGIYVQASSQEVSRYDMDGTLTATVMLPAIVNGLSGWSSPSGWRLLVSTRKTNSLWPADLSSHADTLMRGSMGTPTLDGGLLTTDGDFVRRYDRDGALVWQLGSAVHSALPAGAPITFLMLGGAAMADDGTTFIADAERGLWMVNPRGELLGQVPDSWLGRLTERSPVVLSGGRVFYSNGSKFVGGAQNIVSMPLVGLKALAARFVSKRLGIGAGIKADHALNYYPAGQPGAVNVTFTPSWHGETGRLEVVVRRRDWRQVIADEGGVVARTPLTSAVVDNGLRLDVPDVPGPWEYEVQLVDAGTGKVASATCLDVSRGSAGATLDFATLPPGSGGGGPAPARDVVLQHELGTGLSRLALDWRRIIKSDGSLDFSTYDADVEGASKKAQELGVELEIQVGSGGPETQLVRDKTWGDAVGRAVTRWSKYVHNWEAWNEPNNSYGPAGLYVSDVLQPFARAVHTADSGARVVGGTVVGMSMSYWAAIIKAGGLDSMDIVGLHPYTGHNRGFEEQGTIQAIKTLKTMLAAAGASSKPLWVTEHSWWSNGAYNWMTQADKSARAEIWYRALGVAKWAYFLPEATWGNDGVSFSAIENGDKVKPAALSLMATNDLLGSAPIVPVQTGMPDVYAFRGACQGTAAGSDCISVWSDELRMELAARSRDDVPIRVVDEYGSGTNTRISSGGLRLPVSGAVTWLQVPSGQPVVIQPAETAGDDLAVAAVTSASTSATNNPPSKAVDGDASTNNGDDWNSSSSWASKPADDQPWLQVHFPDVKTVDRVVVSTHSLGSVVTGLRTWVVQVRSGPDAPWATVASAPVQFYDRSLLVSFPATTASDLRIVVQSLNWSGYGLGGKPWFWPAEGTPAASDPNSVWYGPAIIDELRVFAPGEVGAGLRKIGPTATTTCPSRAVAPRKRCSDRHLGTPDRRRRAHRPTLDCRWSGPVDRQRRGGCLQRHR